MPRMDETASFDGVECIHETDDAILCLSVEFGKVWFPKSHVHVDSEVKKMDDSGTLVVTEWIAKEKELI